MRPPAALTATLAGLLTGGLMIASGATPASARPYPLEPATARTATTISVRVAPPVVAAGEPSALVARVKPVRSGRPVTVQHRVGTTWETLTTGSSNGAGRTVVPLDTSVVGTEVLRVVAEAAGDLGQTVSSPVTLKVTDPADCAPRVALVDPAATPAARCLAARLDRWRSAKLMGVGQQVNMSDAGYLGPLAALGDRRVSVVGFDLWELDKTKHYDFPFFDQALADLVALAQDGAVLTASWHAPNPHTGRDYNDRSWHRLSALLQPSTAEAQAFWTAYDEQLTVLAALQAADVAVVFRPFHEVNGDWFWWGRPDPATYRLVYREMQRRAWAAGVHNVVWGYSFAATTRRGIIAPEKLVPAKVDLAGIDTYYPATGSHRAQAPSMSGYAAVAKLVTRMAFTEIGPSADTKRTWTPSVISSLARSLSRKPVWALLWVDDAAGYKQISSLDGGLSWLDSCANALCYLP